MVTPEEVYEHFRGGPQEVEESLGRNSLDIRYLDRHRVAWQQELGDVWVAVYLRRRVAVATTQEQLWAELDEAGIPSAEVVAEFLGPDDATQILRAA